MYNYLIVGLVIYLCFWVWAFVDAQYAVIVDEEPEGEDIKAEAEAERAA